MSNEKEVTIGFETLWTRHGLKPPTQRSNTNMAKNNPVVPAKKVWTDLGAGKSTSMKDHVTNASKGKPELPAKK